VITRARFLRPSDRELARLWDRVRFEAARKSQLETGRATRHRQDAEFATDGGRVALPFVRVVAESPVRPADAGCGVRLDVVSFHRPHFPRLRVGKADR
jgi:hypothetical protein